MFISSCIIVYRQNVCFRISLFWLCRNLIIRISLSSIHISFFSDISFLYPIVTINTCTSINNIMHVYTDIRTFKNSQSYARESRQIKETERSDTMGLRIYTERKLSGTLTINNTLNSLHYRGWLSSALNMTYLNMHCQIYNSSNEPA